MAEGEAPSPNAPLTLSAVPSGQPRPVSGFDQLEQVSDEYEDWADYWEKCLTRDRDWLSVQEAAAVDLIRAARAGRGETPPAPVKADTMPPVTSITGLYERYAIVPGLRPETIKQFRSIILKFVGWLGHDKALAVKPADIVRWRNHLQASLSDRGKPYSPKTINDSYLAAVSLTFAYGLDQLVIPSNPAAGVAKVRAEKKVKLREKDFTHAERQIILTAALAPQPERLSPEHALARRWVPWLCAYTGARVNEMTQLRAEDVTQIEGVWSLAITPEAGSVKTDMARVVPMHEHLIAQGFPAIAKAKGKGPLFYEPAQEGEGYARGRHKRMGMRVADWVHSLGIHGVFPNHGWRHTFKTICREAEIEERAADYMQGHASKGIGRSYGSNTIPALANQLAKFPRFAVEAGAGVPMMGAPLPMPCKSPSGSHQGKVAGC
ncbi:MAG: tyrosine-type recombinase/integrase [Sphingomonadales bacterium]|nr:tyrosine-type recombinase/integrase [Sphingomonadales bacterium]